MKAHLLLLIAVAFLGSCAASASAKMDDGALRLKAIELTTGQATDEEKVARLFTFVRDDIQFNWVFPQDIPQEQVLANGMGVCMQKANLFGALARESGFTTRFKFMWVRKQALEDFLPGWAYKNWMDPFPHTVVEVRLEGTWRSFDPSFDSDLLRICIARGMNFAKYPEITATLQTSFSAEGMKGAQEYWAVDAKEPFYGDDLGPLMEYESTAVPFIKRIFKPMIFNQARSIMDRLRA